MLRDELEGIFHIVFKDLNAYYFKPPNISWGILFPLVLALAFTLKNPSGLSDLGPGLVAMASLFGTTSMEAIVVTFEKRVGALERLFLAPISFSSILIGKVLGGIIFGSVISLVMIFISIFFLGLSISYPLVFLLSLFLTLLSLSSLGAMVAVSVKEVFEAQTLSNYFRFPMLFLCGVFMPVNLLPFPLNYIAYLFPLTYSVDLFRQTLLGPMNTFISFLDILVLLFFSIFFLIFSERQLRKNVE